MGIQKIYAGSATGAKEVKKLYAADPDGKSVLIYDHDPVKIVSWANGTDEEIAAMIDAFYQNKISIDDIKSVWTVGDVRTVSLSAMSATGVGESHRAQDVQMVILDFEHDDLTTAINGHTKALITWGQRDCLRAAGVADDDGASNSEHGYMNSSNTNVGGWTSCARRTWCNSIYYNALPKDFRNLCKSVQKLTSAGNQSATIETTSDYIFLPSEIEIFNSVTNSKSGEGSVYEYYKTSVNRYKMPKWISSYVSDAWWERSPYGSNATRFCAVGGDGGANATSASTALGLAPAGCM